jgi:hypothetical protein
MSRIMIVPTLPPVPGGVGDYAMGLWRRFDEAERSRWRFFVPRPAFAELVSHPDPARPPVEALPERESDIVDALERARAATVALHYVGYGYAPKSGAPCALAEALESWRQRAQNRRLALFVHELWATGAPWTRAFWTHRAQARVACTLWRTSDAAEITTQIARDMLLRRFPGESGTPLDVGAIPSNIDVVETRKPGRATAERVRVVVFGLERTRLMALATHRRLLGALSRRGKLEALVIAGAGLRAGDAHAPEAAVARMLVPGASVEIAGELASPEVSQTIAGADLCLSPTPAHLVGKSGAAMAALAHGVALALSAAKHPCPLRSGEEVFVLRGLSERDGDRPAIDPDELVDRIDAEELARVGERGRVWYESHAAWPVQLARWRRLLGDHAAG